MSYFLTIRSKSIWLVPTAQTFDRMLSRSRINAWARSRLREASSTIVRRAAPLRAVSTTAHASSNGMGAFGRGDSSRVGIRRSGSGLSPARAVRADAQLRDVLLEAGERRELLVERVEQPRDAAVDRRDERVGRRGRIDQRLPHQQRRRFRKSDGLVELAQMKIDDVFRRHRHQSTGGPGSSQGLPGVFTFVRVSAIMRAMMSRMLWCALSAALLSAATLSAQPAID